MATQVTLVTTSRLGSNLAVDNEGNLTAKTIVQTVGVNGTSYLKTSDNKLMPAESWQGNVNFQIRLSVTTRPFLLSDFQNFNAGAGTFQIKANTILGTITGINPQQDYALPELPCGGTLQVTATTWRDTFAQALSAFPYMKFDLYAAPDTLAKPATVNTPTVGMGIFTGVLPGNIVTTLNDSKFEVAAMNSGDISVGSSAITLNNNQSGIGLTFFADLSNPVQADVDALNQKHRLLYAQSGGDVAAPVDISVFGVSHTMQFSVDPTQIVGAGGGGGGN